MGNFDDLASSHLDDIKTEPVKNSANTVKHRWLYPKLANFVSEVLNNTDPTLTIDEQNTLFQNCIDNGIYYQFADNDTFRLFIRRYSDKNKNANLNWIDTSNITDMRGLFVLREFQGDISGWDVSNVKSMDWIFWETTYDVSKVKWLEGKRHGAYEGPYNPIELYEALRDTWDGLQYLFKLDETGNYVLRDPLPPIEEPKNRWGGFVNAIKSFFRKLSV